MRKTPTAVIANGASLSSAIYVGAGRLVGLQMPAAWTTAGLTFQTSYDGVTFQNLYTDGGTEVSVASTAAVASQNVTIPEQTAVWGMWLKIRSGTSGSPVTQGGARSIVAIVQKHPAQEV